MRLNYEKNEISSQITLDHKDKLQNFTCCPSYVFLLFKYSISWFLHQDNAWDMFLLFAFKQKLTWSYWAPRPTSSVQFIPYWVCHLMHNHEPHVCSFSGPNIFSLTMGYTIALHWNLNILYVLHYVTHFSSDFLPQSSRKQTSLPTAIFRNSF